MGRTQWDHSEESAVIRQKNEICSTRFLERLVKYHGEVEEEQAEEEAAPEPEPEPLPLPANFPTLHKVEVIKRAVCKQFKLPISAIESATRKANVVRPRQIAMYLVRKHSNHSYAEIGRRLGGRDHTTILHAFNKIGHLRSMSPQLDADLSALEAQIAT